MSKPQRILITGASGYIGGRLLEALNKTEHVVISMVRRPEQFKKNFPLDHEVRYGDTLNQESLIKALKGIDIVYYLVHSLARKKDFSDAEITSANHFIEAAKINNVKKIVYLGGLFNPKSVLSRHLESRKKVGDILRNSEIPCITFRASIILGSGSISYEMIRNLTEKLPIMITPKWVRVKAQPIGVNDVISYLIKAIDLNINKSEIYEIGGQDQVSYSDIMKEYALQKKLTLFIIPVPFLSPYLSSLWLSFVTPLYAKVGMKLIKSIKNATIVNTPQKTNEAFNIHPMSMKKAIKKAIAAEEKNFIRTHWASAYSSSNVQMGWLEKQVGNKLIYTKKISVNTSINNTFNCIKAIGGKNGWYYATFLWKIRGYLDLMLGGPGHKRGRKNSVEINEGDFIDWWRVEQYSPPKLLRLFAEMKLPGRAWLEFELIKTSKDSCDTYISAIFDPSGLFGRIYWYSLYPIHFFMFDGLIKRIKIKSEKGKLKP